jgi:predicted nucleic acid-binding protein
VLFDTDVLIWVQRGNAKAAKAIESAPRRRISILTQMELMQGVRDKREAQILRSFLADFDFRVLPLTEPIGHRAAVYVEQLALSHGVRASDAIIAATAIESAEPLCTANAKHFRPVPSLELIVLKV